MRGRPKTRTDEAAMFAIWRKVRETVDLGGAKSVAKACEIIMSKGDINFVKNDVLYDRIYADKSARDKAKVGELLRQRYYAADRAAKDAERHPILAARVSAYKQDLEANQTRQRALGKLYAFVRANGHHPDGFTMPREARMALAGLIKKNTN